LFQVEFFVGHVVVATRLGHTIAEVELLAGTTPGDDQRRTAADDPPQVGRRAAGHAAADRGGEEGSPVQRRAPADQEPQDRGGVPVAEASSQNGAGSAEQDVRGRDQALHNPSAQGQGPDLIASRRRRWWGLRRRRRRRLRRRRRSPVAVRVNAVAVCTTGQLRRLMIINYYDKTRYKYRYDDIVMNEEKKNALIVFVITCFSLCLFVLSDNIVM